MLGRIHFQYRCLHDVVIAHVDWHIETFEDLRVWHHQYESYFKGRFSRKVDLILELSKFRLSPKVVGRFRELRNRILDEYTVRSYRVNEPPLGRALMYAGMVLGGGPANQYDTIEEALAALVRDREKGDQADPRAMSRTANAERILSRTASAERVLSRTVSAERVLSRTVSAERRLSHFPSLRPHK